MTFFEYVTFEFRSLRNNNVTFLVVIMFFICGLFVFLIWRVLVPNHFMENSVPEQLITVQSDVFNYYLPKVTVQNMKKRYSKIKGIIVSSKLYFGKSTFSTFWFSEKRNFRVFVFGNLNFSGKRFWTCKSVSSIGCFNPSWNIFRKCSSRSRWWMACYDSSRLVFSFALTSTSLIGWDTLNI